MKFNYKVIKKTEKNTLGDIYSQSVNITVEVNGETLWLIMGTYPFRYYYLSRVQTQEAYLITDLPYEEGKVEEYIKQLKIAVRQLQSSKIKTEEIIETGTI